MRLYTAILSIAFLSLIVGSAHGQQGESPEEGRGTNAGGEENRMWDALLNLLEVHGGEVSYGDVDRILLTKFACKADHDAASIGAKNGGMDIRSRATKFLCRDGEVIRYYGPESKGSESVHYKLELYWFPSKARCFRANAAMTSLEKRGWKTQDLSKGAPGMPLPNEVGAGTQTLKSATSDVFLTVTWVPKENPSQLYSVDPSQGCLMSALVFH